MPKYLSEYFGTSPLGIWDDGNSSFNTLLLNCNGSDASTTFTDSSSSAHTVTANGDAQLDTAYQKFGTASGLLDGTGDYLSVPYVAADFDWWIEDYTIDAWVRASAWTGWSYFSTFTIPTFIGRGSPTGLTRYWSFGPNTSGGLSFYYYNGSGQGFSSAGSLLTANQWEHIALVFDYDQTTVRLYLNGAEVAVNAIAGTPQSTSESLIIGAGNGAYASGWFDAVRITRGLARYLPPSDLGFAVPGAEPA